MSNHMAIGKTVVSFESMEAFYTWKEREEEITYSMYVKDQRSYQPKAMKGDVHGLKLCSNVKMCFLCTLRSC